VENSTECLHTANVLHLPVRKQHKRMTIGIGFSCKDGAVLCADTLLSTDTGTFYEEQNEALAPLLFEGSCGIDSCHSFVKLPAVQMADDQRRKR